MKVAVIPPIAHKELSLLGDIVFLLAHELKDNGEAIDFYSKVEKYKMLDNGAFELKRSISWDDVLDVAREARVNEVVLPDFPYEHPRKTIDASMEALSVVSDSERKQFKFMFVPHGRTPSEYLACFRIGVRLDVDVIGFSIIDLWKESVRLRPFIVQLLHSCGELTDEKEYHLLGLDDVSELLLYRGINIRSVDTSLPFTVAGHDKILQPFQPKFERVEKLLPHQIELAKMNVQILKSFASGEAECYFV